MPTTDEKTAPVVPVALGNVFLRSSDNTWYIRWNGQGAYVGSSDRRKKGALAGLEMLEKLLSSPRWEGSPGQLLSLVHGQHGAAMEFAEVLGIFGVEGMEEAGGHIPKSKSLGFQTSDLSDENTSRLVLRHIESAKALIRSALPELADHLESTLVPPTQWNGVWSHNDPDDTQQWTFGRVEEFDGSSIFRRESPTDWYIRFSTHECRAPHSEGMEMLSVLLLHPGVMMLADRIYSQLGFLPRITKESEDKKMADQERLTREFAELMELTSEFVPELTEIHQVSYSDTHGEDREVDLLPESAYELIEDLQPVVKKLRADAIERRAADNLRARGIPHSAAINAEDDFSALVQR